MKRIALFALSALMATSALQVSALQIAATNINPLLPFRGAYWNPNQNLEGRRLKKQFARLIDEGKFTDAYDLLKDRKYNVFAASDYEKFKRDLILELDSLENSISNVNNDSWSYKMRNISFSGAGVAALTALYQAYQIKKLMNTQKKVSAADLKDMHALGLNPAIFNLHTLKALGALWTAANLVDYGWAGSSQTSDLEKEKVTIQKLVDLLDLRLARWNVAPKTAKVEPVLTTSAIPTESTTTVNVAVETNEEEGDIYQEEEEDDDDDIVAPQAPFIILPIKA